MLRVQQRPVELPPPDNEINMKTLKFEKEIRTTRRNGSRKKTGVDVIILPKRLPLTDTASHYPSISGELCYKAHRPHNPLLNFEKDIRCNVEQVNFAKEFEQRALNSPRLISPRRDAREELSSIDQEIEKIKEQTKEMGKVARTDLLEEEKETARQLIVETDKEGHYKSSLQAMNRNADWEMATREHTKAPAVIESVLGTFHMTRHLSQQRFSRNKPEFYQTLCNNVWNNPWDYAQSRDGHTLHINKPISYSSISKKTDQIPNYTGCIGGKNLDEMDVTGEKFESFTQVRTPQPRATDTARRPAIPGYAGLIPYDKSTEVLGKERQPRAETTAATHVPLPVGGVGNGNAVGTGSGSGSPSNGHKHRGPLSRAVTLVNPYNSFNHKPNASCRTASNIRAVEPTSMRMVRTGDFRYHCPTA